MRNGMQLKPGDTIGLAATARWVDQELVAKAIALFGQWGLKIVCADNLTTRHHQFAGDDKIRIAAFQSMLDDASIKAIVMIRGGYGTIRIMDGLDFTHFTLHPKWICGFSDITVLHSHINDKLGLPTLHCTMPVSFEENTLESIDGLHTVLFNSNYTVDIPAHPFNVNGNATASVIGGNLSILYGLLGTKYGFSTAGKILFLEDIDEYVYHIDRMCMAMLHAGKFNHLAGVIIGGFTDMKDNAVPFGETAYEIIHRYVQPLQIPVCFGYPAGHQSDNRPVIMGAEATLTVGNTGATVSWK